MSTHTHTHMHTLSNKAIKGQRITEPSTQLSIHLNIYLFIQPDICIILHTIIAREERAEGTVLCARRSSASRKLPTKITNKKKKKKAAGPEADTSLPNRAQCISWNWQLLGLVLRPGQTWKRQTEGERKTYSQEKCCKYWSDTQNGACKFRRNT